MKLEVGKYYLTETGEIVGPMSIWDENVDNPFEVEGGSNVFDPCGDIWKRNGESDYDVPLLVKEVEKP